MERFNGYSRILSTGAPAPSATITVYFPSGTLNIATIFSDDGVTPLANPFTADSNGFFFWYAADGDYDVRLSGGGIVTPYTWGDITLGTAVGSAHTWTGVQTFSTPIAVGSGGTGLNASTVTDGQLLIGHDANNNFSLAALTGTANQVVVTNGAGSVTLSLPQSIAAASSPTFTDLTLSGGLVVGFAGAAVADVIQVADANFRFSFTADGVSPGVLYDTGDYLVYNRGSNFHQFVVGTLEVARINASGIEITSGLNVGFGPSAPVADTIAIADANFHLQFASPAAIINMDTGTDRFLFDRTANTFAFQIAAANEVLITGAGMQIMDGLIVGFSGTPSADQVQVGDANFALDVNAGNPQVLFDSGDFFRYDRTSNFWIWDINSNEEMRLDAGGLQIVDGLIVGFSGTPASDTIQVGAATGIVLDYNLGTPFISLGANSASGGTIRFRNNSGLLARNAANTGDVALCGVDTSDRCRIGISNSGGSAATDIMWGKALVGLGGGAAPTFGTIGGSGPAAAGQNSWLRFVDTTGTATFIPVWR